MGVRIQELPETTGINKEDVLIVEDGQGTKKGTVQQLDEALGVSQLKEDLTNVNNTKADKSDLAKTNLYLDALYKLNKGQTYDVLEQESEAYSVDVPSGAKYVGLDMVGGKSVVFNQLIDTSDTPTQTINGITFTNNGDGSITANGTATADVYFIIQDDLPIVDNFILMYGCPSGGSTETYRQRILNNERAGISSDSGNGVVDYGYPEHGKPYKFCLFVANGTTVSDLVFKPQLFNITKQFGYTVKPSISDVISKYEEIGIDIVSHLHSYVNGIISSQNDRLDVASADGTITQQITTNFPVLNSAGSVYDYIDLNEGKLHQRVGVVDLGTLDWRYDSDINKRFRYNEFAVNYNAKMVGVLDKPNILSDMYVAIPNALLSKHDMCVSVYGAGGWILIKNSAYANTESFKTAMKGVMLYYELAEPVITDITIPTELSDWLTVETGGSITFHNLDEGKRLLIPNKETFIRKLDEVTV